VHVQDDVGQVLQRSVVKVVAWLGRREMDPSAPANVTSGAGALALTCWSAKPIHIGELGCTNGAKTRLFWSATARGIPRCANISRVLVNVSPHFSLGDGTFWPASMSLPPRNASTS
jgi:hypothetical protein